MKRLPILLLCLTVLHLPVCGQRLLADLNQGTESSAPQDLLTNERYHAFFAAPELDTYFLYYQRRGANPVEQAPATATAGWASIQGATLIDGSIYFSAYNEEDLLREYLRFDLATESLTTLLTVSSSTPASVNADYALVPGTESSVYFIVERFNNLILYQTDGTEAGTENVTTLDFAEAASLTVIGEELFVFVGDRDFSGSMTNITLLLLIESDLERVILNFIDYESLTLHNWGDEILAVGASRTNQFLYILNLDDLEGTDLRDVLPGDYSSTSFDFANVLNDDLYLAVEDRGQDLGIFRTSTALEEPQLVVNLDAAGVNNPVSNFNYAPEQGLLYFTEIDNRTDSAWLYRTDYTPAGTFALSSFDFEVAFQAVQRLPFVTVGNSAFYVADQGDFGEELWVTDGSVAGTRIVKDIRPGGSGSGITGLVANSTGLLFAATGAGIGREVFASDGTAAGTGYLVDINERAASSFPGGFLALGDSLYFGANTGCGDLITAVTGGDPISTRIIAEPNRLASGGQYVAGTEINGVVYHAVGLESIVRTDGTAAGTREVVSNRPELGVSSLSPPGRVGNLLLAKISSEVTEEFALVAFNPAADTTVVLRKFDRSGSNSVNTVFFPVTSERTMFYNRDIRGQPLFMTDGTVAGTFNLMLTAGSNYRTVRAYTGDEGYAILAATGSAEYEIYYTDGTQPGTEFLSGGLRGVTNIIEYQGAPHFVATDEAGYGLYRVDVAARSVTEIRSLAANFNFVTQISAANDRVMMVVDTDAEGREIWAVSATEDATLLRDIIPGSTSSFPSQLTPLDDRVYFRARNPEPDGRGDLYVTDGTTAGTFAVRTLSNSDNGYSVDNLFAHAGKLYFQALDEEAGFELFVFDPTAPGAMGDSGDTNVGNQHCGPIDSPVSVEQELLRASLTIHPNPASDRVWVRFDGSVGPVYAGLYAADGRRLLGGVMNNGSEFDVSSLPAGLYTLHLRHPNSQETTVRRIAVR